MHPASDSTGTQKEEHAAFVEKSRPAFCHFNEFI
jgi:hypothetical protein